AGRCASRWVRKLHCFVKSARPLRRLREPWVVAAATTVYNRTEGCPEERTVSGGMRMSPQNGKSLAARALLGAALFAAATVGFAQSAGEVEFARGVGFAQTAGQTP